MNTVNHLWLNIIAFENVYAAFRAAARSKRFRDPILAFSHNLEDNLFALIADLRNGVYKPRPFRHFFIFTPKKRLISAPAFRDRVAQHALVRVIEPIFENRFVNESFACRSGRGTHAAMRHVLYCCRRAKRIWRRFFVLKCDIAQFFPSIDHAVIKRLIRRSIRDNKTLRLLDLIIDSYHSANNHGTGLAIGALSSQLLANLCLDPLDHFLKDVCQIKFYARYMDDFIIIHHDKAFLQNLLQEIEAFLRENLKLTLNPKTGIFQDAQGIDFCGYRIWATHVKPRKSTLKRALRRLKSLASRYRTNPAILAHAKASLNSFFGYIRHCSGHKPTLSLLRKAVFKAVSKPASPANDL